MPPLIQNLILKNFTAFHNLKWKQIGQLNVIVGENDTGKTHLLKLLYSYARFFEWQKVPGNSIYKEISALFDKLLFVFNPYGDHFNLVTKGESEGSARIFFNNGGEIALRFQANGSELSTDSSSRSLEALLAELKATFIPSKEILSIFPAIIESRQGEKLLNAFDDTYYDLAKDLQLPVDKNPDKETLYRERFPKLTQGGRVEYQDGEMFFIRKGQQWGMHQIAEGVRKVSILDRLIRNHSIRPDKPNQVLFLDEPETSLHPEAIIHFAEVLHELAQAGVQIFLTTHSYFMLKRLEQISREHKTDYNLLDLRRNENGQIQATESLLKDGLPDNPIIEQSVQLYYKDVDLALGPEDAK